MIISILIVSYNTQALTLDLIRSILNCDFHFEYEIIVIDNNSDDDTISQIKSNFPEVKLICNSQNNLFAKANNQGATIAVGKYLLLLNSDTIVKNGEIGKLLNFIESSEDKVACIGPSVLNTDLTLQSCG